jgi:adenylosuccinate synthase
MNSLTGLCITKLDVLDGLKEIALCTDYEVDAVGSSTPVYEMMPGWDTPTESVKSFTELPENARAYLARIEALCGIPIDIISTGPDRSETIIKRTLI